MIFLWGLPEDPALLRIVQQLRNRGSEYVLVDQRRLPETSLDLSLDGAVEGLLAIGTEKWRLQDVSAAYLRPYDVRRLPEVVRFGAASTTARHIYALEDALSLWTEVTSALVVNRFSAMATNNSKPYQAGWTRRAGFDIPPTVITNSPAHLQAFRASHGPLIYKSTSGVRSIVRELTPGDDERLTDLQWCPTQFQKRVSGIDYRVHVIGTQIFTCRVESSAADYRYAGQGGATLTAVDDLAPEIAERCIRLARGLDLHVAGIDLRQSEDGRWFCFEVNPSPGFPYFEDGAKLPIASAIVDLLTGVCK